MKLSIKTFLYFLLIAWITFSVIYIANDFWKNFKTVQINNAYQKGVEDTVDILIQKAEACELISVFNEEKQIQLINTLCLEEDN